MATLKGIWRFNEILTGKTEVSANINFAVWVKEWVTEDYVNYYWNGNYYKHSCEGMSWFDIYGEEEHESWDLCFYSNEGYYYPVYSEGGAADPQFNPGWGIYNEGVNIRTIDFGATEQEVSEDFYEWFTTNAIKLSDGAYVVQHDTLTTISNAFRAYEGDKFIPFSEMPQTIKKVHDDAYELGNTEGQTEGYTNGYNTGKGEGEDYILLRSFKEYTNDRVVKLGGYCFYKYTILTSVSLPNATQLGSYAFEGCIKLVNVSVPSLKTVTTGAFKGCTGLLKIDLSSSALTRIYTYVFSGCSKLATVIIRSTSLCALSNANAFENTPIASGTGYIYVPDNLVDTYKAATNWATYANQIKPISELEG